VQKTVPVLVNLLQWPIVALLPRFPSLKSASRRLLPLFEPRVVYTWCCCPLEEFKCYVNGAADSCQRLAQLVLAEIHHATQFPNPCEMAQDGVVQLSPTDVLWTFASLFELGIRAKVNRSNSSQRNNILQPVVFVRGELLLNKRRPAGSLDTIAIRCKADQARLR